MPVLLLCLILSGKLQANISTHTLRYAEMFYNSQAGHTMQTQILSRPRDFHQQTLLLYYRLQVGCLISFGPNNFLHIGCQTIEGKNEVNNHVIVGHVIYDVGLLSDFSSVGL